MALQDTWVIRRILSGDREAFGDLVGRYSGLVHGVILNKVRRPDEVEDLVQDVFCKAFEELPKLRDPNRFAPWLARIAQNRAQQWLRQRQTHTSYAPAIEEHLSTYVGDERPDRLLETSESEDILWEALDRLRPEFRQVILLYHFENCRQHDMARFLNVSLPTIKWRLMRARRALHLGIDDVVAGAGELRRPGRQRTKEKILAALPLLALVPRPQRRSGGGPVDDDGATRQDRRAPAAPPRRGDNGHRGRPRRPPRRPAADGGRRRADLPALLGRR